jgi:tripartite ATP-independent transporter DctP family solute receptor
MSYRMIKFAVAAAVGLSAVAAPALAQTKLRFAVETTPGDPTNIMLATTRDELKKTAPEIEVEFFDGGALGDENALTELIRAGEAHVVPLGTDGVVALDPHYAVTESLFLFPDKATARAAYDGKFGALLAASMRKKAGLEVLAFGEIGVRTLTNGKRPVNSPADVKGLKLRTPNSPIRIAAFKALGASPTPMPLGDVYMGLKQGVIDGQENPLAVVKEFSLFEVQKNIALTNHVYTPVTLVMNGKAFDALNQEQQAKIKAAAKIGSDKTRAVSDDADAKLIADFEKAGVTFTRPDIKPFQDAVAPVKDLIAKTVGVEFMAQADEALK